MCPGSARAPCGQSICLPPVILMRCRHWNPWALWLYLLGGHKGLEQHCDPRVELGGVLSLDFGVGTLGSCPLSRCSVGIDSHQLGHAWTFSLNLVHEVPAPAPVSLQPSAEDALGPKCCSIPGTVRSLL